MTSIAVKSTAYQAENRAWLLENIGRTPTCTLDVSLFTENDHYPDGFIPSGIVLGKVTATGLYGPYDDDATDGREDAAGHLFGSLSVKDVTRVSGGLVQRGSVDESKLPANHGLDADAKADLPTIIYSGA